MKKALREHVLDHACAQANVLNALKDSGLENELGRILERGGKIHGIKFIRQETDCGLLPAKYLVELFIQRNFITTPSGGLAPLRSFS